MAILPQTRITAAAQHHSGSDFHTKILNNLVFAYINENKHRNLGIKITVLIWWGKVDSICIFAKGKNRSVAAVQPAASNMPPAYCI